MGENNIRVVVRVRPILPREQDEKIVISMSGPTTKIETTPPRSFNFDASYNSMDPSQDGYSDQEMVYEDSGDLVLKNAMSGYNGCMFAYGQTGSGKSYSMMGYGTEPGIIPRLTEALFHAKEQETASEVRVWVSYAEIYQEQIKDLLSVDGVGGQGGAPPKLEVVEHPTLGVYVPNLTESPVKAVQDVEKLMDFGTKKRVTASTNMNATSSRSHAVFVVKVKRSFGPPPEEGKKDERKAMVSKINLVDLAGSERVSKTGAEGSTLKEGCAINQSLSALGMVIKELSEASAKHKLKDDKAKKGGKTAEVVPFRASKLTFLLKDSLAGNSKTFMIAAISPASDNLEETLSTLRFASSVKQIKTVAKVNKDKKDEIIDNLKKELDKLRMQLQGGVAPSGDIHLEVSQQEQLLASMTTGYEEQVAQARESEAARIAALSNLSLSDSEINSMMAKDK